MRLVSEVCHGPWDQGVFKRGGLSQVLGIRFGKGSGRNRAEKRRKEELSRSKEHKWKV